MSTDTKVDGFSAPMAIPLWAGSAPHALGQKPEDVPTLTVFLPKESAGATPGMVICPGGGYEMLAFEHEGINVARWFQERGVAAFVLKYRLPVDGYMHPVPLLDAQRAMRLVRSRAGEWKVDAAKVGVMGFSAGGHLAATLATHFDPGVAGAVDPVERETCRPACAVLVYPVISMKEGVGHGGSRLNLIGPNPALALVEYLSNEVQVTAETPPTLLVHSVDDQPVPIENSRLMYAALQKSGVASALHEYAFGGHGYGFCAPPAKSNGPAEWLPEAYAWLKAQGLM